MKILLYIVVLAATVLFPGKGTDVGKLIPVEVIAVAEDTGMIMVTTDTGDVGKGENIAAAFLDLEDTAPGVIYLDTAEYLILEQGTEKRIEELRSYLKDNVRICYGEEGITLDGIAAYLSVHKPDTKLNTVSDSGQIPIIYEENGRFRWIEK